jgi:hypothetical protein
MSLREVVQDPVIAGIVKVVGALSLALIAATGLTWQTKLDSKADRTEVVEVRTKVDGQQAQLDRIEQGIRDLRDDLKDKADKP